MKYYNSFKFKIYLQPTAKIFIAKNTEFYKIDHFI